MQQKNNFLLNIFGVNIFYGLWIYSVNPKFMIAFHYVQLVRANIFIVICFSQCKFYDSFSLSNAFK